MTERAVLLGSGSKRSMRRDGVDGKRIQGARKNFRNRSVEGIDRTLVLGLGKLFEEVRKKITDKVERFQKENPLLPEFRARILRTSLGKRVRSELSAPRGRMAAQKKLDVQGELVKKAGSEIALLPEEAKAKEQIEAAFASATCSAIGERSARKTYVEAKRAEETLADSLEREKPGARLTGTGFFTAKPLTQLKEQLAAYKKSKGRRISVLAFKD